MAPIPPEAPSGTVVVIGGGVVGLTAAIALARDGVPVTLVGRVPQPQPGRTVALLQGSVALLERLGAGSALAGQGEPLRTMRIVDATGSLFRPPPITFRADEIGLEAFGINVPNAGLEQSLHTIAERTPLLNVLTDTVVDVRFAPDAGVLTTEAGRTLRTSLVVAADGRSSRARKAAGIGVRTTTHPQTAITAILAHDAPHEGVSTEFHTRQGPFTLVPLPDDADGRHRSSLVWVMRPDEAERRRKLPPEALAGEAERQCQRLLGTMQVDGAVGLFPVTTTLARRLTAPNLVLVGEAAHALPPIGAQGLNLSLRDVAMLSTHLAAVQRRGGDIGAAATLESYGRSRAGDIATRSLGVGVLNRSLITRVPGVDLARGLSLAALDRLGPARRLLMRRGLAPDADRTSAAPRRLARP